MSAKSREVTLAAHAAQACRDRLWATLERRGWPPPYPAGVNIEITNACNSACSMCNRWHSRAAEVRQPGYMDQAVFERILPIVRHARAVNLSGFGEPLLHPEFIPYARAIKRAGASLHFYTNGLALTQEISQSLVAMGADWVHVSVGGASEATQRAFRGTGLAGVVENVQYLCATRASSQSMLPRVTLEVVAVMSALREVEAIADMAAQLQAEHVAFPHLVVHDPALAGESPWQNLVEARDLVAEGRCIAGRTGTILLLPDLERRIGSCHAPFRDLSITWDGLAMSCHREAFVVGDCLRQPPTEVWRGDALRGLRKRFATEGVQEVCPKCSTWDITREAFLDPRPYSRETAVWLVRHRW